MISPESTADSLSNTDFLLNILLEGGDIDVQAALAAGFIPNLDSSEYQRFAAAIKRLRAALPEGTGLQMMGRGSKRDGILPTYQLISK